MVIGAVLAVVLYAAAARGADREIWITLHDSRGGMWMNRIGQSDSYELAPKTDMISHGAFSPDGRRVAYYVQGDGVYVVNNDGTDTRRICDTYTAGRTVNIFWTERGIYWNEGFKDDAENYIGYVNVETGDRKKYTHSRSIKITHFSMDGSGTRGYARLRHEQVNAAYGALLFDIADHGTSMQNEKYDDAGIWDHGSAMSKDGSKVFWVLFGDYFGNTRVPSNEVKNKVYHQAIGVVGHAESTTGDFAKTDLFDWDILHDSVSPPVPYTWIVCNGGVSKAPHTTHANDSLMAYHMHNPDNPDDIRLFLLNFYTRTITDITPVSDKWSKYYGEFWVGPLQNPDGTAERSATAAPKLAAQRIIGIEVFALDGRRVSPRGAPTRMTGLTIYKRMFESGQSTISRSILR